MPDAPIPHESHFSDGTLRVSRGHLRGIEGVFVDRSSERVTVALGSGVLLAIHGSCLEAAKGISDIAETS